VPKTPPPYFYLLRSLIMENEKYEAQKEEFTALCKPLNEWLQKNYHPHAKIIIETDHAEIVEGSMSILFEIKD
jgi:hypothetical protein